MSHCVKENGSLLPPPLRGISYFSESTNAFLYTGYIKSSNGSAAQIRWYSPQKNVIL